MPTRSEKLAAGRTSYNVLRPSSVLANTELTCITSCGDCDFGARTTGRNELRARDRARHVATPEVIVHALRTVRKHVALTGHQAHLRVIESRTYAPRRQAAA